MIGKSQLKYKKKTERIIEPGLTLFCPAYFGAVPCVASNTAVVSDKLAPGAMPIPPTCAAKESCQ
jgi:hypothetical protein